MTAFFKHQKNMKTIQKNTISLSTILLAGVFASARVEAKDPHPELTYETPMTKAAFDSDLGHKAEGEGNRLQHLFLDPEIMFDTKKRTDLLATAKPLLLQYQADFKELGEKFPGMSKFQEGVDQQTTQRLALLGDDETVTRLQADAAGPDVSKASAADAILMDNEWTLADGNVQHQTEIADKLQKLDQTNPDSNALTNLTYKLSGESATTELHDRLMDMAIDMKSPAAVALGKHKAIRDAARDTAAAQGKPFTVTGKTVDGKDFSTADWKGKVIMVDFWATWCSPCKAQLPEIEKLYAEEHDKGFEIVSVSNDFDLKALQKYTAENNMPWPELINADAMAKREWNPQTLGYGIDGIPHSFVIDKKGVLVSSSAGKDFKAIVEKALAEN